MDSYKKFMVAALGPEAVSDKNPEEQEWREQQTVIGHVFSLGSEPDERGDKDFLSPTPERIQRMLLVMSDSQFYFSREKHAHGRLVRKSLLTVDMDVHTVS